MKMLTEMQEQRQLREKEVRSVEDAEVTEPSKAVLTLIQDGDNLDPRDAILPETGIASMNQKPLGSD